MSNTAEHNPCKYINLEDSSIKNIRELQRKVRDRPILNTKQPWEPKDELLQSKLH